MKSDISGIDEMVSVQHLMVTRSSTLEMDSGIGENGVILLMKSGINGIDEMDSSTSITIHS